MQFIKVRSFLLAVMVGLAAVFISLGLLGMTSPALAQGPELDINVPIAQPPPPPPPDDSKLLFIAYFTQEVGIDITDLSGNVVGEGTHGGEVRCNGNNCNQAINITIVFTDPETYNYEYKFKVRQALDPVAERVVVEGQGTLSSRRGQKERFSFTATFQNNRDGTVWVKYEASRPDASFIIPKAPGIFTIFSRR